MGKNPRIEGVMVSAPLLISMSFSFLIYWLQYMLIFIAVTTAWEYNHKIEKRSDEENVMKILKTLRDWISSS